MPSVWCSEDYARTAILPYAEVQIPTGEFTPAIAKAQAWVSSFISPVISRKAFTMASLSDSSPLKLCVALHACYFVARSRFVQRGPNKLEWITDLRDDAKKLLDEIKRNPSKALGLDPVTGQMVQVGTDAIGIMGLQSSKEGIVPSGTLLSETSWMVDQTELTKEANDRGIPYQPPGGG